MAIDKIPSENDASKRLQRIADTLGCSPDVFFDEADGTLMLNDTAQLLRWWVAIRTVQDRNRVLELARSLAAS